MTGLPNGRLRGALAAPGSAPPPVCVDANALGAWADGTMTRGERAAIEAHAAGCGRCLALLSAMTRTEPPPMAPPWWRRSPIAWLLPLAAVTAGLVIVVRLAMVEQRPAASPPVASLPTAAPAPEAPPLANHPQTPPPPPPLPH